MYTANFAIPLLGTFFGGGASWAMFYVYLLGFDFLNAIGHCNFEFVPASLYLARCPPAATARLARWLFGQDGSGRTEQSSPV